MKAKIKTMKITENATVEDCIHAIFETSSRWHSFSEHSTRSGFGGTAVNFRTKGLNGVSQFLRSCEDTMAIFKTDEDFLNTAETCKERSANVLTETSIWKGVLDTTTDYLKQLIVMGDCVKEQLITPKRVDFSKARRKLRTTIKNSAYMKDEVFVADILLLFYGVVKNWANSSRKVFNMQDIDWKKDRNLRSTSYVTDLLESDETSFAFRENATADYKIAYVSKKEKKLYVLASEDGMCGYADKLIGYVFDLSGSLSKAVNNVMVYNFRYQHFSSWFHILFSRDVQIIDCKTGVSRNSLWIEREEDKNAIDELTQHVSLKDMACSPDGVDRFSTLAVPKKLIPTFNTFLIYGAVNPKFPTVTERQLDSMIIENFKVLPKRYISMIASIIESGALKESGQDDK